MGPALSSPSTPPLQRLPSTFITADYLFVDDDPYCRRLFERMCRRSGARALTEASAELALERMEREGPPLVLVTDVSMPGMSGVELVRHVLVRWPKTAIILVSGRTNLIIDELEPNPLVVSVVEKPWDGSRFMSIMERARRMARTRRGEDVTMDLAETPRGVLLVDADPRFIEQAQEAVHGLGPLRVVSRLGEAVNLLSSEPFDLIVSELSLADARGIDAAERLTKAAPETPLVLASQMDDPHLATQVLQLGAEDVVRKEHCTPDALYRSLHFAIERRRTRARLAEASRRDPLTDLASGEALDRCLSSTTEVSRTTAVMIVDVDRFRSVNERLGLEAGDALLKEMADRIRDAVGSQDLVCRRGGDEYIVVLEDGERAEDLVPAILQESRRPFWVHGQPLSITVSMGLALAGGQEVGGRELLAAADRALHQQKRRGRDGWTTAPARQSPVPTGPSIHEALTRQELHLLYQPLWSLGENSVYGFEALLRWVPRRGEGASPARFIPELEANGGIVEVGAWVMDRACAEMADIARSLPSDSRLSVNVSPRQLQSDEIMETIERALVTHGLAPERLQIEITETVLLPDARDIARRLAALREMGVRIALDDFGVGYSSLSHLHRHPIDTVKIDRSLVSGVENDERARLIVASIATLGENLGMTVVAEGVEWAGQLQRLREAGCHAAQGYLLGRPAPSWTPEELTAVGLALDTRASLT